MHKMPSFQHFFQGSLTIGHPSIKWLLSFILNMYPSLLPFSFARYWIEFLSFVFYMQYLILRGVAVLWYSFHILLLPWVLSSVTGERRHLSFCITCILSILCCYYWEWAIDIRMFATIILLPSEHATKNWLNGTGTVLVPIGKEAGQNQPLNRKQNWNGSNQFYSQKGFLEFSHSSTSPGWGRVLALVVIISKCLLPFI